VSDLWRDVTLAARLLARDRRFTAAAVVALGLGIGLNTTVFSLINAVELRDLPFDEPDRLALLRSRDARGQEVGVSYPDFRDWRDSLTSFAGVAASADSFMNLCEEGGAPERLRGTYVTAETFRVLRTAPILGRDFLATDDRPGAPPVVIIGYGVWQQRFGADPSIVGRTVRVNDVPSTVIGVMPRGFKYPFLSDIWQPLSLWPGSPSARRDARTLGVVGRLRDSVELPAAAADVETIAGRLAREYPATNAGVRSVAKPLKQQRPGIPKPLLTAMIGAVGLVLLVGYANLANLLLARSVGRSRELAIRTALGASRWRIIRQLLVECGLLAILGGTLGFLLSLYGVGQVAVAADVIEPGAAPGSTRPYWFDFSPDAVVYAFAGGLSLISALAFGLLPAWHISRVDANDMLKEGGRSGRGGARARRWTSVLLTGELALTLVLLTAAGLLGRSFMSQYRADIVIDPTDLVTMRLALPAQQYRTPDDRRRFFVRLQERLGSLSGFASATIVSHAPLEFGGPARELSVEGMPLAPNQQAPVVTYVLAGADYFELLKLPVVHGRAFTEEDATIGQQSVIVDQRFVTRFFPDEDPIGRRIQLRAVAPPGQAAPANQNSMEQWWLTIVGVTRTLPHVGPREFVRPVVYRPFGADPAPDARAVVIVKGNLTAAAKALREEVATVDPTLPLFGIETLDAAVARSRISVRLFSRWFGVVAMVALVLASVGLYALTAHGVAERVHEIGVRMALGARAAQVVWLFLRRTVIQLAIGLALGMAGALSIGQLLQSFLEDTNPRDPLTVGGVAVVLTCVAVAATFVPARRAARIDPMLALRRE